MPANIKLIAGIESPSIDALVRDGLNARESGADGLLVLPPFDIRPYRRLAQNPTAVLEVFDRLDR